MQKKQKRRFKRFIQRHSRSYAKRQKLIEKYREFDQYELDLLVHPPQKVWIPKALPSEPPEGVEYTFGPSGYMGDENSDCCIMPVSWRNPNNYCHWTFSELPLLYLAYSSPASKVIIPKSLLYGQRAFQKQWIAALSERFPEKNVLPLSKFTQSSKTLIPINHDTSSSNKPIGKCMYKHYHHSRATPYLIEISNLLKKIIGVCAPSAVKKIYIERANRRLTNELHVQRYVKSCGFEIVALEQLSVGQQITLFSEASHIIGFHGAGLTNILYCNPNAYIIEIVDPDCVYPSYLDGVVIPGKKATRTYYHMLAYMKGLTYHALESHNYTLDVKRLETTLQKTV